MKEENKTSQLIDVGRIVKFYVKNWIVFFVTIFLALGVTYVYHLYQTPVYSLNTTLLIEDKTANILLPDGTTSIFNSKAIDNEIALLKSHSQIKLIIDQLDFNVSYFEEGDLQTIEIYKDSPFIVEYNDTLPQPLEQQINLKIVDKGHFVLQTENLMFDGKTKYAFGERIRGEQYNFKIKTRNPDITPTILTKSYLFIIHKKDNLINTFRNKLNMKLERGTSLLVIATSGTNIEKEKDFLNKLTEVYIKGNLERKNQISNNTIEFIEKQLAQIRQSLDDVESELENFRKDNNLMKLTDKAVPILSRVNTLNKNKADQLLDLKYYNYLKDYLMTHDKFDDIVAPSTVGISLPLFSDLLLKLSTTQIEKDGLMANSSYENPYIKTLETEIHNQKQVLLENIDNVIKISEMKIEDFDNQIADRLEEFEKLPTLERHYLEINRLYKLNSEMYTYMLEKRSEVEIAKATNVPDLVQIDRAGDNGIWKMTPDTKSNYTRSFIFGLLIPAILLFLLQISDRKISEKEDILALSSLPVSASIPGFSLASGNSIVDYPYSDFSISLKKLGAGIKSGNGDQQKVIAVTSSIFGEGKSIIAANLAISFALTGKRTLIVNFDFHKQGLQNIFSKSQKSNIDLFPVTENENNINEWIFNSQFSDLDLFMPQADNRHSNDLIINQLMDQLNQHTKGIYDYIILDTPPLGLTSDIFEISNYIDVLIYLVRNKITPKTILKSTLQMVQDHKQLKNVWLVYNGIKTGTKTSSYDYYNMKESKTIIGRLVFRIRNSFF